MREEDIQWFQYVRDNHCLCNYIINILIYFFLFFTCAQFTGWSLQVHVRSVSWDDDGSGGWNQLIIKSNFLLYRVSSGWCPCITTTWMGSWQMRWVWGKLFRQLPSSHTWWKRRESMDLISSLCLCRKYLTSLLCVPNSSYEWTLKWILWLYYIKIHIWYVCTYIHIWLCLDVTFFVKLLIFFFSVTFVL